MNIKNNARNFLAIALVPLCVVGCTPNDTTFGGAVKTTMAAQVVNPDPQYEDGEMDANGEKAASASERYRTGKVEQPKGIQTTDTGTTPQ